MIAAALLAATLNGHAALTCARLFLDEGKIADAKFFATLAGQEGTAGTDGKLLAVRLYALEGEGDYTEIERMVAEHPESAHAAGEAMLRSAPDLLERAKFWDAGMAVRTAVQLDPSLRPVAQLWLFSVIRAKLTPRNALDVLPFVGAASGADHAAEGDFLLEIARRALAMRQPNLAALAARQGLLIQGSTHRPELARILVEAARSFTPGKPLLAQEALNLATAVDPSLNAREDVLRMKQVTAPCGRVGQPCPPIVFLGSGCGTVTSPFADHFESDERFFPGATYGLPLPRPRVPADAAHREAQCRALAPPLFPDPFKVARDQAVFISGPDAAAIDHLQATPCIEQSTWDLVVGRDGHVESMKVRLAAFPNGDNHDPEAIALEQRRIEPLVRQQQFRPPMLGGVPVRSENWGAALRDCVPR